MFLEFLVVLADDVSLNARLEVSNDLRQSFVSHVLQHAQHSGAKEHLSVPEPIVVLIERKS